MDVDHEEEDGRKRRTINTRATIIKAVVYMIEVLKCTPWEVTGQRVADVAGCGHRTLFEHFHGMNDLYEAAGYKAVWEKV